MSDIKICCEHTDRVGPDKLKPHPKNPNKHPASQIRMLAKSIKRFGWRHPIVVSKRSGFIVAGHARRQAAVDLGCVAPVDYQNFRDDIEETAVLLADNILPELAEMDHQLFIENRDTLASANIPLDSIGIPELEIPDFPEENEDSQPELDSKKKSTCPECGYVFEA